MEISAEEVLHANISRTAKQWISEMPGIIMIGEEKWLVTRRHGGLGEGEIPSGIKPNQIQPENVCAPHLWFCLKVFWEINNESGQKKKNSTNGMQRYLH